MDKARSTEEHQEQVVRRTADGRYVRVGCPVCGERGSGRQSIRAWHLAHDHNDSMVRRAAR